MCSPGVRTAEFNQTLENSCAIGDYLHTVSGRVSAETTSVDEPCTPRLTKLQQTS